MRRPAKLCLAFLAVVSLSAAAGLAGAAEPPATGSIMFAVAPTADPDRALAFYTKGLGMTQIRRTDHGAFTESSFTWPGEKSGIMLTYSKAGAAPNQARGMSNRLVLTVRDLRALAARLAAAGYPLRQPLRELPGNAIIGFAEDPDGNMFELVQLPPG